MDEEKISKSISEIRNKIFVELDELSSGIMELKIIRVDCETCCMMLSDEYPLHDDDGIKKNYLLRVGNQADKLIKSMSAAYERLEAVYDDLLDIIRNT